MRPSFVIVTLFVLCSLSAHGQVQTPTTDQQPATPNNAVDTAALCNTPPQHLAGFAARYPWYAHAIQSQIGEKLQRDEVDPHVESALRVCMIFDLNRAGEPSNARIAQSSGAPSVDEALLHALSRVSSFGPLPEDWEHDKVRIAFRFEYRRACTAEDYLKSSNNSEAGNKLQIHQPEGITLSLGKQLKFGVNGGGSWITIAHWSIEGEQCKTNDCGSVSDLGLYTAPRTMPPDPQIVLKVEEKTQPCRTGATRLTLIPEEVH